MNIVRKVLEDRYRDLACLAYLISDDGHIDEQRLAAGVHRALWEAVPRELRRTGQSADEAADVYAVLRRRLLASLVNGPKHDGRIWRWYRALTRPRLPRWLQVTGAWWKAASGRWFLLAAGAPGLRAFGADGALTTAARTGSFTAFSAGAATPASLGPVLVDAATKNGPNATTVLPPAHG